MKELWIEAEEQVKGDFYNKFDRDPTEEELQRLMETAWPEHCAGLIDDAMMLRS